MEKILIIDFGGKYNFNLAQKVREQRVYCEFKTEIVHESIGEYKGVILADGDGGYTDEQKRTAQAVLKMGVPVLGIGYGARLLAKLLGGETEASTLGFGNFNLAVDVSCTMFSNVTAHTVCTGDCAEIISRLPLGFRISAKIEGCPNAAIENAKKHIYALQFFPQLRGTTEGEKILFNFLFKICGCKEEWTMPSFVGKTINRLETELADKTAVCVISGSVVSLAAAVLLHRVIGDRLTCVFVNNGLLREGEAEMTVELFRKRYDIDVCYEDISESVKQALQGKTDSAEKTKLVKDMTEDAVKRTVGQLPSVDYNIVEDCFGRESEGLVCNVVAEGKRLAPFGTLTFDEIVLVANELGLAEELTALKPLPVEGVVNAVGGEFSFEKLALAKKLEALLRGEITAANVDGLLCDFGVVVNDGCAIISASVRTDSGMVWAKLPYGILANVSERIIAETEIKEVYYKIF